MFRPCNRAIVWLFNRDHQIDYIIGGLMVSVEQREDGPIAEPKHVVVIYYIVLFMIY